LITCIKIPFTGFIADATSTTVTMVVVAVVVHMIVFVTAMAALWY
jgi:hypothetical protein